MGLATSFRTTLTRRQKVHLNLTILQDTEPISVMQDQVTEHYQYLWSEGQATKKRLSQFFMRNHHGIGDFIFTPAVFN